VDHDNLRTALAWMLRHDPEDALEMAAGMAGLWLMRGYLREGSNWLDRALRAAPAATLARTEALHARQALDRRRPDTYDVADQLCQERVGIHHLRGDARGECLALLDLTDGHLLGGRFAAAAELPDRARELAVELGERGLEAAARERNGIAAAWRGEYETAMGAFDEAMDLCESAPADALPSSAVVSLACFLADGGSTSSYPIVRFEETGLHFRRLPPKTARASLLGHRAYLHRAEGRFAEARADLDLALEIVEAADSHLDTARLTAQRGCVETTAGDLDAAREWLERSLAQRRRLREHRGILLTLANLAVVSAYAGNPAGADALLTEAGQMAREAVDGPGMGAVELARAEIARRGGRLEAARDALEQAIEVFYGRARLANQLAWLHTQQAYLSLELGDLAPAEQKLATARSLFAETDIALGIAYCSAIEERLRAANTALA
jgi:tetratricopeptide (TPR) repeat protein